MPLPSRPRRLAPLALLALAACGDRERVPPSVEFLVSAGDSSYWVRTGPDAGPRGIVVRRGPLFLARLDGRFHEVYVTEEDYSFHDAAFTSQTVWRRDLVSDDSAVVFGDATVARLALAYARANPDARPLAPDEPGADEPRASAALEVALVDVLGHWLVVETFADVHSARGPELHRARRGVVDLRTGTVASLARLVGDSAARAAVARGRVAFARARDSVIRAPGDGDGRAVAALAAVAFDPRSFGLARLHRGPGVVFHVPAGDEGGHLLPLAPIPLPGGVWWQEASVAAPVADAGDALRGAAEWRRGDVTVSLRPGRRHAAYDVVLRARGREWMVARIALPADRLHWLDDEATPEHRRALARAFADAARYGGAYSAVARPAAPSASNAPVALRHVARTSVASRAVVRHPARIPHAPR